MWNLVTIAIVLVILFVYRKLDTDNRSLEKLRKYYEKIKSEIDVIVEERKMALKDMTIEFDVYEKTIKEAYTEIEAGIEKLKGRGKEIEVIGKRLDSYGSVLNELSDMTSKADENLRRLHEESKFVDSVEKNIERFSSNLSRISGEVDAVSENFAHKNEASLEAVKIKFFNNVELRINSIKDEMEQAADKVSAFNEQIKDLTGRQELVSDEAVKNLDSILNDKLDEFRSETEKFAEDYLGRLDLLKEKNKAAEEGLFMKLEKESRSRAAETKKLIDSEISKTDAELTERIKMFDGRIAEFNKNEEARLLGIEQNLANYEDSINYKFAALEKIPSDIDSLQSTLDALIKNLSVKIRDDFHNFETAMEKEKEEHKARFDSEMKDIQTVIDALDKEIAGLKVKAYENVSEKLKLFESDFFADLKNRDDEMQTKFAMWKTQMEEANKELMEKNINIRESLETEYVENLRNQVNELQMKTNAAFEKYEHRVGVFENSITDRIGVVNGILKDFEEHTKADIEEVRAGNNVAFNHEFEAQNAAVIEKMKNYEEEISEKLKALSDSVSLNKDNVGDVIDNMKSDIKIRYAKIEQDLKDSETSVANQAAKFKTDFFEMMENLKNEYDSGCSSLEKTVEGDREKVKEQMQALVSEFHSFKDKFQADSALLIQDLGSKSASVLEDLKKQSSEAQSEMEDKVKAFKNDTKEIKEKVEQTEKKFMGKVDENLRIITLTINELDKKIKNFQSQTKIFDRADSLRDTLLSKIEDMKKEIVNADSQSKGIKEAERKFDKIKKMGDEISSKLSRFNGEKEKINEIEGDFKKLLNISENVDGKLADITGVHDHLLEVEMKIKNLDKLFEDINGKYDRLKKKDATLETTITEIDKNFEDIQTIEGTIKELEISAEEIPIKLKDTEQRFKEIEADRANIERSLKLLGNLDKSISTTETRMEKLDKSLEWIAKTETRLQEAVKKGEETISLLGVLVDKSGSPAGSGKGFVSEKSDTVKKLAKRGWSNEKIADMLKISVGEVELIRDFNSGN